MKHKPERGKEVKTKSNQNAMKFCVVCSAVDEGKQNLNGLIFIQRRGEGVRL